MSGPTPNVPAGLAVAATPRMAVEVLVEGVLDAVAGVLQRRPDLLRALQVLVGPAAPAAAVAATPPFLSVAQYAAYRSVSERTVRYDVEKMEEGKHFQRAGRKGRRIVIHMQEADAWYAERSRTIAPASSIEQLAVDEVTRRRARVALKKRKEK